jgi:hypothetical protein
MKRINRSVSVTLLSSILIVSVLLSGCGATPAPAPPIVVQPNPVSNNNGTYINILINSLQFTGTVSNLGDTGNLQFIMVASDNSGHSDALICPYGGVIQVHTGDNINPCQAGLTYPQNLLQGNLNLMLIAVDVKDKSDLADVGTNLIASGLSTGLGAAIQGTSEMMSPELAIGLIALSTVIGYAGTKTQEYFQRNYVIGSQSFVMSSQYNWNNGQPVSAAASNQQVNFNFTVQQSTTVSGQVVGGPSVATAFVNPTATQVSSNSPSTSEEENYSDPAEFARWYFTAVWQDRNYDYLWTLSTPSFQSAASTGGYNEFTSWWGSVDKADIGSVSVLNNDGHYASIHVVITFHLHDGRVLQNRQYDYDLVFNSDRQTWMFDYR